MCQCSPDLQRNGEGYVTDTAQQNTDLAGPPGPTRDSDVLLGSGRGECMCSMSLRLWLTGEVSTLLGSKVLTLKRKKL